MTKFHQAMLAAALACLITNSAAAAPWIDPGDPRARFAAQKLADTGNNSLLTTTWPIMWAGAEPANIANKTAAPQPGTLMASAYLRFEKEQQAQAGFRGEFSLNGQTETPAITGFESEQPAKAGTSLNLQWQGNTMAMGLNTQYAHNAEDNRDFRLDGSYLATTAGNWVVGAGAINRWWGPGWQSSLILSSNARPVPSVWLNRKTHQAANTPWLSWVGPWQFTLLAGQLEGNRTVPDANLLAARFTFMPLTGLELGLSSATVFDGKGQSRNDKGNQLVSADLRYGIAIGQQSLGLYAQALDEQNAENQPAGNAWLFGADWTTQLLSADQQWFIEYSNTLADDLFGTAKPGATYTHNTYQTGYRYYGRNMGASTGGDATLITLGAYHFLANGSNASAKISQAEFNKAANGQKDAILELAYGTEMLHGWLDVTLQAADRKIEYLSETKDQWSLGARWTYRF